MELLSIWEVGHRWQGVDPRVQLPDGVPIEVQDRLRQLAHAAIAFINPYDAHGEIIPMEKLWFGFPKTQFGKHLDKAVHDPLAYKALLGDVYLNQTEVMKWCFGTDLDLPEFWFESADFEWQRQLRGGSHSTKVSPAKPRPDQVDRAKCREIALQLWKEHPNMTIADMCRRREIQLDGNGKAYKGKYTLRNWLKDLAPETVRKRRGRPKKAKLPQ